MASIYSWESFIRIHGGEPGARDVFEKLMDALLRAENPDKEVHIVKASRGDGGIDVYVHREDGIDIYQCKFFMETLNSSRWSQIKESFKKAMEPKGVKVLRWYLCMPREMQKEDIEKWKEYKDKKENEFPDIELRCIDGNRIISRLEECDRLKNTALIDKYFHENHKKHFTNKDLIIPFTMSKANGAQGGTYVQRDDLLDKTEERFKTERIVFLSGMGGCGKSELARAYGYRHRDDYEEIFWLTCDDGVIPDFKRLMDRADLLCKIEKSDTKGFSDKILIVVDNCNSDAPEFLGELENWTGDAKILVTTRLNRIGDYETVIPVESDDPELFAYKVFERNYCKKPRWGSAKTISEEDTYAVRGVCTAVQYNAMVVSLIAIRLREYSNLSVPECAEKMRRGIGEIVGEIKYGKDQRTRLAEMKDILKALFDDILNYPFSAEQKAVLTVLSLTPATWYEMDYICSLLRGMSNEYAVGQLLDFGWLQGNGDSMTIHPLIAEVISDQPILIQEGEFFEGLLENYLGLPDKFFGKERFLINKVLNNADNASSGTKISIMLAINHGGYRRLFQENHPHVQTAYFVYVNHEGKRYFEYRDLVENETHSLTEAVCSEYEAEQAALLGVYNTGIPYVLDISISFHGIWIHEIPDGFRMKDPFLSKCLFNEYLVNIGKDAFYSCRELQGELHLSDSLTSIGDSAFWGCRGLSGELNLPEGLTSIGSSAFRGCSGLSGELNLPEGLTSIGDFAFSGCRGLSGELNLPEGLTSIGDFAFSGCRGLSGELNLPEGLTSIGDFAFYGCSGLSGELKLPEGLTSIGKSAFSGCSGLSGELNLPEGLTSIGDFAFDGCSGLSGELKLPEGLTSIGSWAFWGCSGLSGELKLQEGLTSIGPSAFSGCSGLSGELKLQEGLTSIGPSAFSGRSDLSGELKLPEGLTSIGPSAFEGCSGLSGELKLPAGLTSIGDSAFDGCSGLSGELKLPAGLTSIGDSAFDGCSGLSGELKLPEGLTSIGDSAFSGCSGLSGELKLPEGLTSIGDSAFEGCSGLSGELKLPEGLTSIGDSAFEGCSSLSGELKLPEGLTSIGDSAFEGCSSLSGELKLPEGLTSIGDWAFNGCSGLSGELKLPAGLTSIGDSAFDGCSGLSGELKLPEGLTSIGDSAFSGCSGLSGELKLPEGLTSIGDCAYWGCSGLSGELKLPAGLTSIGDSAFWGCSGLSGELKLPAGLTRIGVCAFWGCSGLSGELKLPKNLIYLGNCAFDGCNLLERIIFLNPNVEIKGEVYPYSSIIIVGYRHSTADIYAQKYGLVFEELE